MGVYIPKVEMPKSCFYCPFRLKINPDDIKCFALQREFEETFGGTIERRLPDCPLVEVKAPHGRLIDADALEQNAQERMLICNQNDNQFQKPYEVMRAIALAPTIIPAEEG